MDPRHRPRRSALTAPSEFGGPPSLGPDDELGEDPDYLEALQYLTDRRTSGNHPHRSDQA